MFSPLSECREFPAELVCQLDPQVAHLEMMVTMATISTPHGAADVEILTLIDGRVAPVVLEVQEVPVDRVAQAGLADLEVLEEADGPVAAEVRLRLLIRSTTVSLCRRKICRR